MKDYYAVLGVLPSIDDAALAAVYRALVKKFHPDVFQGIPAEALRITQELNEAYEVLGNPKRRADYDQKRRAEKSNAGDYEGQSADEGTDRGARDADIEGNWGYITRYYPGAESERVRLYRISRNLAFQYQIFILENKNPEAFQKVSDVLQLEFLIRYFGANRKVHSYVIEALIEGRRDVASEVNKAVKILGSPSEDYASSFLTNVSDKCGWEPSWVRDQFRRSAASVNNVRENPNFPGWWIGGIAAIAVLVLIVAGSQPDKSTVSQAPAPSSLVSKPSSEQPTSPPPRILPSFDCAKITSDVLRLVCGDQGLAQLDQNLSRSYALAMSKSGSPSALRDDERAWIYARNNSAADVNLLSQLYKNRIAALDATTQIEPANQPPSPPNQDQVADPQKSSVVEATVSAAVSKFYSDYQNGGTSQVGTDLNDCYAKATSVTVMYCVALDTIAESVFPAVEKSMNWPRTPQWEDATYDARVRQNLNLHGVTDIGDQNQLLVSVTKLAMADLENRLKK